MNIRLGIFSLAAVLLSACGNNVTGQKEHNVPLVTTIDSVSYGIGTEVGPDLQRNLKSSGLDSLNKEAMFAGMRDAMDSTERIPADSLRAIVQNFMKGAHDKMMAQQQVEADAELTKGKAFLADNGKKPGVVTTASGLEYQVITMGTGPKPAATDSVRLNYTGTLIDGTKFDSSLDHGGPIDYPVSGFIPGWQEALQLMPAGSKWKLFIPSDLAYGPRGSGKLIPGNSTLIFDLDLIEVLNKKK
ncbi:MAG: FKBP-type peptidyl-prolyl cis-trans isomerase [Flavobacteriales bacterium]